MGYDQLFYVSSYVKIGLSYAQVEARGLVGQVRESSPELGAFQVWLPALNSTIKVDGRQLREAHDPTHVLCGHCKSGDGSSILDDCRYCGYPSNKRIAKLWKEKPHHPFFQFCPKYSGAKAEEQAATSSSGGAPRGVVAASQLNAKLAVHFKHLAEEEQARGGDYLSDAMCRAYRAAANAILQAPQPITSRTIAATIRGLGRASLDIIEQWLRQNGAVD